MRGVGQTQNLIDNLPDFRCAIIVKTPQIGRMIKERIEIDRGKEFAKRVKFFIVNDIDDVYKLSGYSNPIFFDHSFFDLSEIETAKKTLEFAHSASIVYQRSKNK